MASEVKKAVDALSEALKPFGEGVEAPPEIDVRVSWIDVSTNDGKRFLPVVELHGQQKVTLDLR